VKYHDGYRRRASAWKTALGTFALSAILLGAFAGSVYLFRKEDGSAPSPKEGAAASPAIAAVIPTSALTDTSADLVDQHSSAKVGIATRGQKDGAFEFLVTMNPPAIDRETQAYVVWLLRPVPFDFFSLGEMVTDDTGAFVTDWLGEKDKSYDAYTRIIITLQPKGAPDPAANQVIKGVFGAP